MNAIPQPLICGPVLTWTIRKVGDEYRWFTPGWHKWVDGEPCRIFGWRLWLHRLLWGFDGLLDAREWKGRK